MLPNQLENICTAVIKNIFLICVLFHISCFIISKTSQYVQCIAWHKFKAQITMKLTYLHFVISLGLGIKNGIFHIK